MSVMLFLFAVFVRKKVERKQRKSNIAEKKLKKVVANVWINDIMGY